MRTLEILDKLVGFNTVSAISNLDLIAFVQEILTRAGFTITRLEFGEKAGLFAVKGEGDGGVLLSAHSDVVPVAGQNWTTDPFRLTQRDDRVFGRGTTDMKGFLAAMLAAAERFDGQEPLKLVISFDEELGCLGIAQMLPGLRPLLGRPRACVVGEPTEMQVAIGHKGKAAYRAEFKGEAGHSAMAPQFTNAIHGAADLVQTLRHLQDQVALEDRDDAYDIPYCTVHVGKISSGRALNIVPDHAQVDFEFRYLASQSKETLETRLNMPFTELFSYPGLDVAEEADVVNWARNMGGGAVTKVAFGTEAGYFADLGIPTIVCGPGSMSGQGHKPDEFLSLDQLSACDAMMTKVLHDLR